MSNDPQIEALKAQMAELDRKLEKLWKQLDVQLSDDHQMELVKKAFAGSRAFSELKDQVSKIQKA